VAAPRFAPVSPVEPVRGYRSPDHVPAPWVADRPGDITGRPLDRRGARLGNQGPDQGYALRLADGLRHSVITQPGERVDDVLAGCVAIGLRRASTYGRAPVIHDLRVALAIWGFLDREPPAELVAVRRSMFAGLADGAHGYDQARVLVDRIPEATFRMTPDQVTAAFPGRWSELTGTATDG